MLVIIRPHEAGDPVVVEGTMPALVCEIAFATDPLDAPTWVDVSQYLRAFTVNRGRSFEYDRMETGTATYLLENNDGRFSPENTTSPYYPNVKPTRRIRFRAVWSGNSYSLFDGHTEGFPQVLTHEYDALVKQTASDLFSALARIKFPPNLTLQQDLSGERILDSLKYVSPTGTIANIPLSIAPGDSTIAATDVSGQSLLEHMLLVAEAENGRLFIASDGTFTFQNRSLVASTFGISGIIGDGRDVPAGNKEISYTPKLQLTHDETRMFNVIRVKAADGTIGAAQDDDSIDDHFERTLEKDWPLADALEAQAAAEYMLGRLKTTNLRVPQAEIEPLLDPGYLFPYVLGFELGQRYGFRYRPKSGADTIDKAVIVDGIQHEVGPHSWKTTLSLVLADFQTYWLLDDPTRSVLDTTTRLAY